MTFDGGDDAIPSLEDAMRAEHASEEQAERARVGRVLDTAYLAAEAVEKRREASA